MKYQGAKPVISVPKDKAVSFDGQTFIELLNTVLAKGASCRFQAKGFSMSPFIQNGDIITVSPLGNNLPVTGDVAAFINPETEKIVVHRVVGKKGNCFLIKADSSREYPSDLVPRENIIGCVKKVERDGRRIFFGTGPERYLIAFFNRWSILHLFVPIWRFIPHVVRRRVL